MNTATPFGATYLEAILPAAYGCACGDVIAFDDASVSGYDHLHPYGDPDYIVYP